MSTFASVYLLLFVLCTFQYLNHQYYAYNYASNAVRRYSCAFMDSCVSLGIAEGRRRRIIPYENSSHLHLQHTYGNLCLNIQMCKRNSVNNHFSLNVQPSSKGVFFSVNVKAV